MTGSTLVNLKIVDEGIAAVDAPCEAPLAEVIAVLAGRAEAKFFAFRAPLSEEKLKRYLVLFSKSPVVGLIARRGDDPFAVITQSAWHELGGFTEQLSFGDAIKDLIDRGIRSRFFSVAEIQPEQPAKARLRKQPDLSFSALGFRFEAGIKEEAIITVKEPIVQKPEKTTKIIELAVSYLRHGAFIESQKLLEALIEVRSDIPDLLLLKAFAEVNLGCKDDAEESLNKLLVQVPGHQEAINLLNSIRQQG